MKFVTLNPRTRNVNLIKDVGLIPYYLHILFDVDSTVVTYRNDEEYPYLDTQVKGLKAEFIKKKFGRQIDGMLYVLKHAMEIDVLNVYHLNTATLLAEWAYRLKNKKGKIYLKLDMSQEGLRTVLLKDPRGLIKRMDIKLADVVSVETRKIQEVLVKNFGDKIIYVTNGCLLPDAGEANAGSELVESEAVELELKGLKTEEFKSEELKSVESKLSESVNSDNTILTVANFGTWEKASDTLLEAFAKSAENHDYKLKIIGSVADDFKPSIEKFYSENPEMKDRVLFLGEIHDREKLMEEYRKAKIFTLPSRQESFGIVLVEAAYEGCYLVTTEATTAGYDVSDDGKYGSIVRTDDIDDLSRAFTEICTDKDFDWEKHAESISAYARKVFNWEAIITDLYEELRD